MNNQLGKKLAAVSGKNVSIDPEEHYDLWAKQYEKELSKDSKKLTKEENVVVFQF